MSRLRVAVLVSGTGTNLQAILDRLHGRDGIEIVGVVSNKPNAKALERARGAGVETAVFERPDHADRAERDAAIGDWLAARCRDGGVMSCSALKRKYRDQLRLHCPDVTFLHLAGSLEVIGRRQASRPGHFMPASLLASQFETLEPLAADERGVSIDVDQDIDSIVESYLALTATRATEQEKK